MGKNNLVAKGCLLVSILKSEIIWDIYCNKGTHHMGKKISTFIQKKKTLILTQLRKLKLK